MIIAVDVYNIAFAAQHTLGRTLESTGAGSQALFGTLKTILSQVSRYLTYNGLFLVFDHGRTNWRKQLYPEYKANRTQVEPDPAKERERAMVMAAIEELYNMRDFAPWYTLRMPDTEADDLLAALAHHYQDSQVVLVSNDKDLRQLCTQHMVTIWAPMRGVEVNKRTWEEINKVNSTSTKNPGSWCPGMGYLYCIYRAFVGDASDNIPGVPGWGELTAAKVFDKGRWEHIEGERTLDQLRDHPEELLQAAGISTWKSLAKKTRDNWHIFERNYELMSLVIGAARLPDDWQNWIYWPTVPWNEGRGMMWNFFQARQYNSLLTAFDKFDMMGTRIRN